MNIDNRIKFRHLVCFLEAVRQGSLARTAEALAISPPAVSKTIKELEAILTVSLFDRSKQGVVLSEAGMAFMRYAGPSVRALREGVRNLRNGEYEGGAVRLGVLSSAESSLLPDVVRRLHAEHASLVVTVMTGPSAYLLGQLRAGDLDLVVGRMADSPEIEGMTFEHLYSESLLLVVRPEHPLLVNESCEPHQLSEYPAVLPLPGTTIRRSTDSLYVQYGIALPQQRLETLSVALSRRYVESSDAVWVAPADAVHQDLQRGELVALRLGMQEPGGSVGICSNPATQLSLASQWCCEALRAAAKDYRHSLHH